MTLRAIASQQRLGTPEEVADYLGFDEHEVLGALSGDQIETIAEATFGEAEVADPLERLVDTPAHLLHPFEHAPLDDYTLVRKLLTHAEAEYTVAAITKPDGTTTYRIQKLGLAPDRKLTH